MPTVTSGTATTTLGIADSSGVHEIEGGLTTTTTIIRTVRGKKWNEAHRSHAYQNLARILDNHSIVTIGVIIYHILWLLPLAVWTVLKPDLAIIAVILAFLPSIILYSSIPLKEFLIFFFTIIFFLIIGI